jgi:hypothetical protein
MLKLFFKTTVFVVLFFIPKLVFGNVVINEIMYDLETGSDSGREWVEIFNNGDTNIDLTDWKFWENDTNHKLTIFQGNTTLPPNGYAVITDKPESFLIDNPAYPGIIFDSTFSLNNSGENLTLKDNNLTTIDEVLYSSSWGASGNGRSLQKKDSTTWGSGIPTPGELNNVSLEETAPTSEQTTAQQETSITNNPPLPDAGNDIIAFVGQKINFDGTESTDPDGNELAYSWNMGDGELIEKPNFSYAYPYPGTYMVALMVYDGRYYVTDTITVKIQSIQIIINEFMPNPSGKDEEAEWIEIYNDSEGIADISGWQIDDDEEGSSPFIFPQNTLIAPKSYLVFPRQITGIALNNDKDTVRLLLPEDVVFQEVNYENPPQGKSSARNKEGFVWSTPTPGAINLSITTTNESKKVVYQGAIEKKTTKEPSRNIAIEYTAPSQKIEEGYAEIATAETNTESKNQLALARDSISKHISSNLVYVFTIIVLAGLAIGLLLAKFLRHKSEFPQT